MTVDNNSHLSTVATADQNREKDPKVALKIIAQIKSSLLMNPDNKWEDMLGAAPIALHSMGICFVTASAPEAASIMLDIVAGSKLRYTSLRANLVEGGALGCRAFMEAQSGMDLIGQLSSGVYETVEDVVECLQTPEDARTSLRVQMESLRDTADECYQEAKKIDDKFLEWLNFMSDFHAACEQKSTNTEHDLQDTKVNLAVQESIKDDQEAQVKENKRLAEKYEKHLDEMEKQYKKAAEAIPSGWEVFGQEMIRSLINTGTGLLNGMMGARTGGMMGGMGGMGNTNNSNTGGMKGGNPLNPTQQMNNASQYYNVYAAVHKDMPLFTALHTVLTGGPDGSVQWDADEKNPNAGPAFLKQMFEHSLQAFASAQPGTPDATYQGYLQTAVKVATELEDEITQRHQMSQTSLPADDPKVQQWKSEYQVAYDNVARLKATADSQPGAAAGQMTPMANMNYNTNGQSQSGGDSALAAAQARLESAQSAMSNAESLYDHSVQALGEKETELSKTKALLTKLANTKLSLEAVKKILLESIQLIAGLRIQIRQLVSFFDALSNMIKTAVDLGVKKFLKLVTAAITGGESSDLDGLQIGDFTLTDLHRSQIFSSVVYIRAYFSVFADIAKMWNQLSVKSIMPGLDLCNDMSRLSDSSGNELMQKQSQLDAWSDDAQANVKQIAGETQRKILAGMGSRVQKIEDDTKYLPPSPAKKAIEEGAETAKTDGKKAIDNSTNRFSLGGGEDDEY
ncbi:hypothetical protein BDV23DRAFT_65742 [Aspergillus alliaceus]|uniref:Uncharacterized protein n=1 Tax=Petromyces alliaceus TaxID=209559 RepID=A0A5N7CP81_PETAA|nr:hypothetical protein BDV23DRAFT_65742 [Aspergillus alliaceus]